MQAKRHCRNCAGELVRRSGKQHYWSCQNNNCRQFCRPVFLKIADKVRDGRPANPGAVEAYYKFVGNDLKRVEPFE